MRLTKEKTEMKREHWTKRWNWSSCTKLALSASWTHGLIAQSVRASEFSGRGFKSHSGQLSIATSENPSVVNTICINSFHNNVIICEKLFLKQMWRLTKAKTEMKCEYWTKRWNWSSCTKLDLRMVINWDLSSTFPIWSIFLWQTR